MAMPVVASVVAPCAAIPAALLTIVALRLAVIASILAVVVSILSPFAAILARRLPAPFATPFAAVFASFVSPILAILAAILAPVTTLVAAFVTTILAPFAAVLPPSIALIAARFARTFPPVLPQFTPVLACLAPILAPLAAVLVLLGTPSMPIFGQRTRTAVCHSVAPDLLPCAGGGSLVSATLDADIRLSRPGDNRLALGNNRIETGFDPCRLARLAHVRGLRLPFGSIRTLLSRRPAKLDIFRSRPGIACGRLTSMAAPVLARLAALDLVGVDHHTLCLRSGLRGAPGGHYQTQGNASARAQQSSQTHHVTLLGKPARSSSRSVLIIEAGFPLSEPTSILNATSLGLRGRAAGPSLRTMIETLDHVRADIACRLQRGVRNRRSPMHSPSIATADAAIRIMVLRAFHAERWELALNTDSRAAKCEAIAADPRVGVLFYDQPAKIQLRCRGVARIERQGLVADEAWDKASNLARRCYLGEGPGVRATGPASGLPDWAEGIEPSAEQVAPARPNFAVLIIKLIEVDWLHLAHEGHRRAIITRSDARWVTP